MRVQDEESPEEITVCIHCMHPEDINNDKAPRPRLLSIVSNGSQTSIQALANCVEKILAREPLDSLALVDRSLNKPSASTADSSREQLGEEPNNVPERPLNPLAVKILKATEAVFNQINRDSLDVPSSPDILNFPDTPTSPRKPSSATMPDPVKYSSDSDPQNTADFNQNTLHSVPRDTVNPTGPMEGLATDDIPRSISNPPITESSQADQTYSNLALKVLSENPTYAKVEQFDPAPERTNPPESPASLPQRTPSRNTALIDQASVEHEARSVIAKRRSSAGSAKLPLPKIRLIRATDDYYDEAPDTASLRASIDTLPDLSSSADVERTMIAANGSPENYPSIPMNTIERTNGSEVMPKDFARVPTCATKIPAYGRRTSSNISSHSKTISTASNDNSPLASPDSPRSTKSNSGSIASSKKGKQDGTGGGNQNPVLIPDEVKSTASSSMNSVQASEPTREVPEGYVEVKAQELQHIGKGRRLVRKTRRIILRKPVLEMLLGRQLAGQTQPALRMMAEGTDHGASMGIDAEAAVAASSTDGSSTTREPSIAGGDRCEKCSNCTCKRK